jgi:hypothetical protein
MLVTTGSVALSEFLRELARNLDPSRSWWVWQPESATPWDWCYRGFNLFEGVCWLVFGGMVLRRWMVHRQSRWEWAYAGAFVAFGLTDFREACEQSLGLVFIKGVVLAILLAFRQRAIHVWYPGSRLL